MTKRCRASMFKCLLLHCFNPNVCHPNGFWPKGIEHLCLHTFSYTVFNQMSVGWRDFWSKGIEHLCLNTFTGFNQTSFNQKASNKLHIFQDFLEKLVTLQNLLFKLKKNSKCKFHDLFLFWSISARVLKSWFVRK